MIEEGSSLPAKYVYFDVVGYTRNSMDTQSKIVDTLYKAAEFGLEQLHIPEDRRILLPTGDGVCIVLVSSSLSERLIQEQYEEPYDLHIRLARRMLIPINTHNEFAVSRPELFTGKTRPQDVFQVRIGINQSDSDIFYTDINDSWNVAGDGINRAQRAMSLADGNQIIVTERVYEDLHNWEEFADSFRGPYEAEVKHGEGLRVYQHVREESSRLNNDPPSSFNDP